MHPDLAIATWAAVMSIRSLYSESSGPPARGGNKGREGTVT